MDTRDDDRVRLLQRPREELAAARRGRESWARFAFAGERTESGRLVDRNRAARSGVVWAAQYDRRGEDLELLRFLLRQEIEHYRITEVSGLSTDLELPGFLVAEHRRVDDVWLHWAANNISFDTGLGYRLEHLLTAGVAATVEAVQASEHPERDALLRNISKATDARVEKWLAARRVKFPGSPEEESPRVWANQAARLGDREASRRFILEWAQQQPRTGSTLNSVQFHLAGLGFLDDAIRVQTEAVALAGSEPEGANRLLALAELRRRAEEQRERDRG